MPDTQATLPAFDKNNKISELKPLERKALAQRYSKRFSHASTEINPLILDSRDGWDYYLKSTPDKTTTQGLARQGTKLDAGSTEPVRNSLRYGLIPKTVDSVLSLLHNSIFPADERFFAGTPKNDVALQHQEAYERFRADNFAEIQASEQLRRYLLTLCIDPAACLALPWRTKKRKKVIYEAPKLELGGITIPIPVLGLKTKTDNNYVEWEGTALECLDFNDWRCDPYATSFEESWFIRRWYEPTWKVQEEYDLKEEPDAYHSAYEEFDDPDSNLKKLYSGLIRPIPFDLEEEGKEKALLMVCYDDFKIDGKLYKNHCAIFLNGIDTIWFGENIYNHGQKPYIVTSLLPIPNQIYGLSLIKHAIPSAAVSDTITDKILRIGALVADPIFEVDMMEPVFKKTRTVRPGMTFPVKRKGAISQVQINVANLTILENLQERVERNIQEVTGSSQMIEGGSFNQQPANITAFQVDQHMQGSNQRFQAIQNNFCNTVLDPLLSQSFENDRQFKTQTEYVPVGDAQNELTPDLIKQMDFKWVITSNNAAASKGKRLANLMQIFTGVLPQMAQFGMLAPPDMVTQPDVFNLFKLICVLGGVPNFEQLFKQVPAQPPAPPPGGNPNGLPALPPTVGGPSDAPPVVPQGGPVLPGAPASNGGQPATG